MKDKSPKFQVPSSKSPKGIISFIWLFTWNLEFGTWNLGLIIGLIGIACNKEEPIPSYIHIAQINLTTNLSVQGSSAHKIIDAWIYIDDQLAGAFEMPCTIPVLEQGSHTLKIFAGIKENGISETRITYPFYSMYEQTVTLTPGQITPIAPTVTYSPASDFIWMEDFDGASHSLCNNAAVEDTIMTITTTPSEVFEGTGSGKVSITTPSYIGYSCEQYVLPKYGAPVFLELNYACNTDFNVGIVGYAGSVIEVQSISLSLRPTTGWNKVYVNLSNEISNAGNATKFKIFFSMIKNQNIPASYFYLDNVKLIH